MDSVDFIHPNSITNTTKMMVDNLSWTKVGTIAPVVFLFPTATQSKHGIVTEETTAPLVQSIHRMVDSGHYHPPTTERGRSEGVSCGTYELESTSRTSIECPSVPLLLEIAIVIFDPLRAK